MKARVAAYAMVGVFLLVLLDPRTFSDENYGRGEDGRTILGIQIVGAWFFALVLLTIVVVAVEGAVGHEARRRAIDVPLGHATP